MQHVIAASIGATAMLAASPRPALADTDYVNVTGQIIRYLLKIYLPWVEQIIDYAEQFILTMTDGSVDVETTAWGSYGDSINEVIRATSNETTKREQDPSPNDCSDPAVGKALYEMNEAVERGRRRAIRNKACEAKQTNLSKVTEFRDRRVNEHKNLKNKSATAYADITSSSLLTRKGYDDTTTPTLFIDNLVGETWLATLSAAKSAEDGESPSPKLDVYEQEQNTYVSRALLALDLLYSIYYARVRSDRHVGDLKGTATPYEKTVLDNLVSEDGLSLVDLLEYEVLRTLANPAWQDRLEDYGAHAPVEKTIVKLLATRTLLLEMLAKQEELKGLAYAAIGLGESENKQVQPEFNIA